MLAAQFGTEACLRALLDAGAAPAVDKQLKADNSFCVTHGARRGAQGASQGPRNLAARA